MPHLQPQPQVLVIILLKCNEDKMVHCCVSVLPSVSLTLHASINPLVSSVRYSTYPPPPHALDIRHPINPICRLIFIKRRLNIFGDTYGSRLVIVETTSGIFDNAIRAGVAAIMVIACCCAKYTAIPPMNTV